MTNVKYYKKLKGMWDGIKDWPKIDTIEFDYRLKRLYFRTNESVPIPHTTVTGQRPKEFAMVVPDKETADYLVGFIKKKEKFTGDKQYLIYYGPTLGPDSLNL